RREIRLIKASMLKKRREAEATLRDTFAETPEVSAGLVALVQNQAERPPGGPPKFNKGPQAAMLLDMALEAKASAAGGGSGMQPEALQRMLDNGQQDMARLYRHGAHLQSPAEPALGGRSVRM